MQIVPLHPALPCADLVQGLRNIADNIERGNCAFTPNMIAVVIATETQRRDADGIIANYQWQTHGLGEKASVFATRGLLASAAAAFEGGDE